jgi:3-(methylthio)propanoyl-CoA dehydrogenase
LIGRKLARDGGLAAQAVIAQMRTVAAELPAEPNLSAMAPVFSAAIDALERSIRYVVQNYATDIRSVSVGAVPLLKLFGIVAGGWQLLRSALIAQRRLAATTRGSAGSGAADAGFYEAKIATARFYTDYVLSQAPGLAHGVVHGAVGALAEDVL